MTIRKLKLASALTLGVALMGSLPFVTRAQNHNAPDLPQAALLNPHPIPSDTATRLGSLSLPAVSGWTKEYGDYRPSIEAVYYRSIVAGTPLLGKVLYMPTPPGVVLPRLEQTEKEVERTLADAKQNPGEKGTLLKSTLIRYQQRPAVFMLREVRIGGKVERIQSLMFNRGKAQYQLYLYVHSQAPAALKAGDLFWQRLTSGLHDQGN